MGLKSITVYFNTGFDGLNIPGKPSVLDGAQSRMYSEFYFLRESVDLPVVRIRDSYDNLADVDYVKIYDRTSQQSTYYFATPHAEAKGTTSLALVLDGLLTMGGAENLNYTSGWITRGHISAADDALFANVTPEDFQPSKPLIVDAWTPVDSSEETEDPLRIVITSVNLSALEGLSEHLVEIMQGMGADGVTPAVTTPLIRASAAGTQFRVPSVASSGVFGFYIPGMAAYNRNKSVVKDALSKLFSAGQLQLANSYTIPGKWINTYSEDSASGLFTGINGHSEALEISESPFEYMTVKNKKALALFRTANLISLASGDKMTAAIYDIRGAQEANPHLRLWADPSPNGKPYCAFSYLQTGGGAGTGIDFPYARAVHGSQWPSDQLVLEGASGSAWNALSAAFAKAQNAQAYESTIINNQQARGSLAERIGVQSLIAGQWESQERLKGAGVALSTGTAFASGDLTGGTSQLLGATGQLIGMDAAAAQNALALNELSRQAEALNRQTDLARRQNIMRANEIGMGEIKANAVTPTVLFTPEINLGYIGYNYFAYYETRLHPQDVAELDAYFQRYGYSGLHIPLAPEALRTRQYYNFVQAHDIGINSPRGMRVRERGIEQLTGGVRIWHVLPDRNWYDVN